MKNKTKYAIFATLAAVLICASLVLLMPTYHRASGTEFEREEMNAESVYKFIYDIKAGNLEGARRAALAMPLSGSASKLLHRIITNIRENKLTEEENILISAIVDETDASKIVSEIEYAAAKENKTIAENDEKTESNARKAVMRILDNGIRLNALNETPADHIICLGAENMYVETDKREMFILHLSYDCNIGERRLTEKESEERAVKFLLRNMPRRYSASRPKAEYVCENGGCDCFIVTVGHAETWIKIRRDTGSVVLFCGYGMELKV